MSFLATDQYPTFDLLGRAWKDSDDDVAQAQPVVILPFVCTKFKEVAFLPKTCNVI